MTPRIEATVWATRRLELHREKIEALDQNEIETAVLRGRIAELKELLAALSDRTLPVWIDASQDASGL